MITKENVHITSLPIGDQLASVSLTPLEKIESLLRQSSSPPSSLSAAWMEFEKLSFLIETGSDTLLEDFFSCSNTDSLTTLAGNLLTLARNDKTMLTAVRSLMSRLSTLGNYLNRIQQARILSMKFSDTFFIFNLIKILELKIRERKFLSLFLLRNRTLSENTVLPKTVAQMPQLSVGQTGIGNLPALRVGKISGPPPPPIVGNLSAPPPVPMIVSGPPGKASPPVIGKAPPPPKMGGKAFGPPLVRAPSLPVGKSSGPPIGTAPKSITSLPVFPTPEMEPGTEYRKVHWQSIPVSRFEKSIFKKIYENIFENNIDFELIKKHFVRDKSEIKTPIKSRELPTAAGTPLIGSVSPQVMCLPSVLDQKRIQQIEIFLNKYRNLTKPFLESLVCESSQQDCESSVELLESILALFPTPEEQTVLHTIASNPLPLAKADKFLIDLSINIPEFKTAAAARIILSTFSSSFSNLESYLTVFNSKVNDVLSSTALVDVFRIIGSLVVFLGNKKSTFNGFGIDNISSLRKINSFSNKEYSGFNCILELMSESDCNALISVIADESTKQILESDFEEILIQVSELEKAVLLRLGKIDFIAKSFYAKIIDEKELFMEQSCPKINSLVALRESAKLNAKLIREYFGENDKKSINEIFGTLRSFGNDLMSVKKKRSRN